MFNTAKHPSVVSERTMKNKQMWESYLFLIIWGEMYENYHLQGRFFF
jgi:hypothetical protein